MSALHILVNERKLHAATIAALKTAVDEYVAQLMGDLKIPPASIVKVKWEPNPDGDDAPPLAIAFHDRAPQTIDDVSSETALLDAIYHGRRLLYGALSQKNLASTIWPEQRASADALYLLRSTINSCVDRNLSLDRLVREAKKISNPEALRGDFSLLLDVHTEADLKVEIAASIDARDVWNDGVTPAISRAVFEAKGVPCPLPSLKWRSDLAPNEVIIAINDVRLPARRVGEGAAALVDVIDVVRPHAGVFITREGVQRMLDLLSDTHPLLVDQFKQRLTLDIAVVFLSQALAHPAVTLADFASVADLALCSYIAAELDPAFAVRFFPASDSAPYVLGTFSETWKVIVGL